MTQLLSVNLDVRCDLDEAPQQRHLVRAYVRPPEAPILPGRRGILELRDGRVRTKRASPATP